MLMINDSQIHNNKVQISIMELDGREYIVFLKTVGMFKCYLEDFETKKRSVSDSFMTQAEAVEDAWNKMIKEE
ncbi:hypothetical protein SAMN04487895_101682 [Paenibacillus sophorae]|uniref:Uncharacterized protein n=1 Tax=Paenibacillus sophorae TaxID=1333845 RepID=A0A1H8GZZ0_9BACL|nr:hypothetical protein [Paenibacillus sophorae]QWU14376.1 hypothetical protein KP014_20940 [Paenibacillus sophorae]SEN48788.1 hypothetical protein SAMN04487895_101682 [Paenibacillus sophorae]